MVERTRHYRTAGREDLTPRQSEVLQLVAAGKTNPEIAEELGITLDGAKFHIREILAKLDVDSREEAAEWWKAQRGIGTRVASFLRSLSPVGWLKPMAIGSAIGGTTLGLVAVGFAMNGGGDHEPSAAALRGPACDTATLTWKTRQLMDPDPATGLHYAMSAAAPEDCVLDAVIGVSGYGANPDRLGGTFSFVLGGPIAATIEKQQLGPVETPLIVGRAANVCNSGQFVMLAITVPTQTSYDLEPPLPPCIDPVKGPTFTAEWAANAKALANGEPQWWEDSPSALADCNPQALGWTHDLAIDPFTGLRFTWSVESASRCRLDARLRLEVSGPGGAGLLTPLNIAGSPADIPVLQELGIGSTTMVTGVLSNLCGQASLMMSLSTGGAAYNVLDIPVPPCTDPSKPANLAAMWSAMLSSQQAQTVPFEGGVTDDSAARLYTVKAGDTLPSIALALGTTPARIMLLNPGLDPDRLRIGEEIRIPAPKPTPTATPAGRTIMCDVRTGNCPIPPARDCDFPGCLIAKELLRDIDGWLAQAEGRRLLLDQPPGLYSLKTGERKVVSVAQFQTVAGDYLRLSPTLFAVGDEQKSGVLDLLFLTADGRAFSIAIEPRPDNTYPPIGITFWDGLLPADGAYAETSFGTALYRRVSP